MIKMYLLCLLNFDFEVKNKQLTTWAGAVRDNYQGDGGCLEWKERLSFKARKGNEQSDHSSWLMIIVQN